MNVDGTPNVRTCMTPVREGMRVTHQNAYPSLEKTGCRRTAFRLADAGGLVLQDHSRIAAAWHAAEPYIRKAAGLGEVPLPDAMRREYEHA